MAATSPARTGFPASSRRLSWCEPPPAGYELDFRPGGIERNRAVLDDKRITWEAVYREIVPDERIAYTGVLSEDETVATLSLTTVEFVAEGDGTKLVLVEAGAFLDGREQPTWREHDTLPGRDAKRAGLPVHARRPSYCCAWVN